MNNKKLFLLGGYDLEMLEIKAILERLHVSYQDKNLSWGAKLSDYAEFLNFDGEIYAVELEEDVVLPLNYHAIDHHGENSDKPSSLEQVAKLLHVELARKQELIAANDKEYISGMKKLCATKEEIMSIRKADRQAQGVTGVDEELAKSSAEASSSNIIFAHTPHFSAISDLVYEKYGDYIIYNEEKIVFYGYKCLHVKEFLASQGITQKSFYYGGGDFGFVGIKQNFLSKKEIENLIEEFKKVEDKGTIYSYHTFMLPFRFDTKNNKQIKKDILEGWKFEPYENNYNEIAYFHSFFQKSMFVKEEKDKNSAFYTKDAYKNSAFIICKSEEYKLNLKSVNLRIFKTGVGILSFHLENKTHSNIKAILEINDFGRRIYPEYLDFEKEFCGLVPNYIKMGDIEERFEFDKNQTTPKLSKIIQALLPTDKITPAVDDRMFVISFYNNKEIAKELKNDYTCHDKWYEYIFIDGDGITVQNKEMQKKLIQKATYARWQQYGTMYGMSKYSFVCLADSDFPLKHMQTMYFQMFSLLLMVRASILKFSDETSTIADDMDKDISENVSDIYKRYIQFVNNFYFREITAKDQGLELYEKAIDILRIERDIKDLDAEIEELHTYVELLEEKKRTESMNKISKLGSYLLLPALISSFFGMNIINFDKYKDLVYSENVTAILAIGLIIFSGFLVPIILSSKSNNKEIHE